MKRNRKSIIPGILIMVFSLAALIGSRTILGPCVHDDGSFGACHWAGQAMMGVSALNLAESCCILFVKNNGFRRGAFVYTVLTGILGILVPGTLIGLCGMATMRCRTIMRPAMTILFSLICVSALAGTFLPGPDSSEQVR